MVVWILKKFGFSSQEKINNLYTDDLKKGINMIKSLKGIENGLGVLIIVFHLIFLAEKLYI